MADKQEESNLIMEQSSTAAPPPSYTAGPMAEQSAASAHLPRPPVTFVVAQAGLPKHLHPHNYLFFSIYVAIFCGFFMILTLLCSIPALIVSLTSYVSTRRGHYNRGKSLGNWAAGLSVCALLCGMLLEFFAGVFIACWIPVLGCSSLCNYDSGQDIPICSYLF